MIRLRRPITRPPSGFERDVFYLANALYLRVEWCRPEPNEKTVGRASVYTRDYAMVEGSDLVILFVGAEDPIGHSGTMHLLDAALQADRPVYAYGVAADGTVTRVGEYDPDHLYADIAPAP